MQFRDHAAVQSKRDIFMVDPRKIKVEAGYNVRDLTTPDARAKLEELTLSIIANGIREPLGVRLDGKDIILVEGHRRLRAVMDAIEFHGAEILGVPAIPESKGRNDADRVLDLIVSNSGEPLLPMEMAEVVRRLLGFGWDESRIVQRTGKTKAQVKALIELLGSPEEIQNMVKQGEVSASVAVKTVRKEGGAAAAVTLKKAKASASTKGKGKGKVTAKAIAKSKGQKAPLRAGQVEVLLTGLRKIAKTGDHDGSKAQKLLHSLGLTVEE